MKKIYKNDLDIDTTSRTQYLILKIISKVIVSKNLINFLGEDENEEVMAINFENFYKLKNNEEGENLFKLNGYVLIIEPHYKFFDNYDGIKIESSEQIKFFENENSLNEYFNKIDEESNSDLTEEKIIELKNSADSYLESNIIYEAIKIYNKLIKKDNKYLSDIYYKLSSAYIKIGLYENALKYSNLSIELDKENISKVYNKLICLINLQQFDEANDLMNNPLYKDKNELNLINEINNRKENLKGIYNFYELYQKSKKSNYIDITEYKNPKIKISFDKEKGVKLITTETIERGELLMVSKAVDVCCDKKINYYEKLNIISEDILNKFEISPEKLSEFCKLYNVNNFEIPYEERKIIKHPSFNFILEGVQLNIIDLKTFFFQKLINSKDLKLDIKKRGIWFFPSFINHSCNPNTLFFNLGDIIIVVAIQKIFKNMELTRNYLEIDFNYNYRKNGLPMSYGVFCKCTLCKFEENKLKTSKEKILLNDLYNKLVTSSTKLDKNEKIEKEDEKIENILKEVDNFIKENDDKLTSYEKAFFYYDYEKQKKILWNNIPKDINLLKKGYEYISQIKNKNDYIKYALLTLMIEYYKENKMKNECEDCILKLKNLIKEFIVNQDKFVDLLFEDKNIKYE
jgi:tetratricopeptide (TPR) repeat protein